MEIAIASAVGAGLCNAVGAVLQRRAAVSAPSGTLFRARLITYLLRQRKWQLGAAFGVAAFWLQALALTSGRLSLVEPLLMSELPFLLMIMLVFFHEPIGRREWLGGISIALGLGFLLGLANPHGGTVTDSGLGWAVTAGLTLLAVALAVWITHRTGRAAVRAAAMGTAAGGVFALTAALTKLAIMQFDQGWALFLTSWPPYALLAAGIASVIIAQNVFRAGPLAASQPAMMIADPTASVVIGLLLFHDQLRHTPLFLAGELLAAFILVAGVVLLGSSPVIINEQSLSI